MTTTFGTITNIQFVANRHNLKESSPDTKVSVLDPRSPSGQLTPRHSEREFDCESNSCRINSGKSPCCYNSPCTPNGLICTNFGYQGMILSPPLSGGGSTSRPSSDTSGSSSLKGSDSVSSGLAVEESPTGALRFATDRPHLVSMGGGRLSTSVTLHPINEGVTTLGAGGMGVVPDIAVIGTGIEPEHCLLEHKDGSVYLTPLAPLVSIDGLRTTSRTRLTQGCMICLGRSHYFRFNHPTEAKLMRAILPNARISMAPIAFYPAVDNPEYFHMAAQEAAGSGEARINNESGDSSSSSVDGGSTHPLVPPRKNPPSSLDLHSRNDVPLENVENKLIQSKNASSPSYAEKVENNLGHNNNSNNNKNSDEHSDSDSPPPDVPPRSEGLYPQYVNSITPSTSKNLSYLGEYIYTRGEDDLEPSSTNVSKGSSVSHVSGGVGTMIFHNGVTMAHNAMYRSIPPSLLQQQEALSTTTTLTSTTIIAQSPTYSLASPINSNSSIVITPTSSSSITSTSCTFNHSCSHYSTPKPPLPVDAIDSFVPKFMPARGSLTESPPSEPSPRLNGQVDNSLLLGMRSFTKMSSENLKISEKKKQQAHEDRLREEEAAAAEKARLDEILRMCAEYDRQQSGGSTGGASTSPGGSVTPPPKSQHSPYHTLTQNRIKTNGSLPREKRSPLGSPPPSHMKVNSPSGCIPPVSPLISSSRRAGTPSEDELTSIFSFESDAGCGSSNCTSLVSSFRNDTLSPYPPFPNLPSGSQGVPSPPPVSPRSPYENVSLYHHGYSAPLSPRTRIRTTVGRDRRDFCEVFENKMALHDFHSPPPYGGNKLYTFGTTRDVVKYVPKENGVVEAPVKPPRSPRIERDILGDDATQKHKVNNVIDNKHFLEVTPNAKVDKRVTAEDRVNWCNKVQYQGEKNVLSFPSVVATEYAKARSKVFEEHVLKNIQDTFNINDVASEVTRLKEEKNKALRKTVELKAKITDLETEENEALRELEMERALMEGELNSLRCELKRDEEELSLLQKKSVEMDKKHDEDRAKDRETINSCKLRLDNAESELDSLDGKDGRLLSEEEFKENAEVIRLRHEAVDVEKKIFEDIEFSQMESEALRESEREELNKEISDLMEKILEQKDKLLDLESQMSEITSSVRTDADTLETERQELLSQMNKVMLHVSSVERQMAELARLGAVAVPNGRLSPLSSSDTEESDGTDLADRLAQLHLLDRSQEDLDRINQISTSSPLEYRDGTLGRKTSAALMEVERNRQLTLVKQGTQVINDEKKRVEELKRRVAQEAKVEWEERRKERTDREVACASIESVGSEESSLTSSEIHVESVSSDDVMAQRSSGDSSTKVVLKMRHRDSETPPGFVEQNRPLSDASSSCDIEGQPPVRFREKARTQQRPLTRYLPVRSEEHFDLRLHIESAGHQIELCPYLTLNHMSCRGYLHKLGSKFRTWQKRWFVFDRSKRALVYYSDKTESKPKGGTYFQAIEDVYVDHHSVKSPSPKLTFCVKTHDRIFQLMAPSPEAMRIWIDVIFTGAEGYQEFQGGT